MPTPPRVAIIGAGPAGCTLARLLSLSPAPVDVAVFEAEAGIDYRSQGGTLDLHTATGLAAVREAGLWDEFLRHARYDGESLQMTDKDLRVYLEMKPSKPGDTKAIGQRPEIDRADLRRVLLESLPEGTVRWNHRLRAVEAGEAGTATLVFEHGAAAPGFDLVVGADGAWSKVRPFLSDAQPAFAGVGLHSLNIPDAARTAPEVHRAARGGSLFAHKDGARLSVQQLGSGAVVVGACLVQEAPDWAARCGFDTGSPEQVKAALLGEGGAFADFHPTLRAAIAKADGPCVARSLYNLPVGFSWPHRRGATLIGDAAHLMTPFAGEGVNAAMEDARRLAQAIVGATAAAAELDAAVEAFEKGTFARVEKVARISDELRKAWLFTPGVPGSVIAHTSALHLKTLSHPLAYPFIAAASYGYFFVKGLLRGA